MKHFLLSAPVLLLAACSDEPEQVLEDDSDLVAKGEILGGSISDEMLPLESVTSQSPPLAGEEERLRQLAEEQEAASTAEADQEEVGDGTVTASESSSSPVSEPAPVIEPEG